MSYKVVPIPQSISDQVRKTMISPQYKHPASVATATGYGPCRSCLRTFDSGRDQRILFTYNSFEGLSDLPMPGPIFVHATECKPFDADGEFPPDLVELPLLFECFGAGSELLQREPVVTPVAEQLAKLFRLKRARFINVRNAEAGCFVARVDRLEDIGS